MKPTSKKEKKDNLKKINIEDLKKDKKNEDNLKKMKMTLKKMKTT
jgi:hypothetical protein